MIRQLGKFTMFLTLSVAKVRLSHLLQILCKLQGKTGVTALLKELNAIRWNQFVNEDQYLCDFLQKTGGCHHDGVSAQNDKSICRVSYSRLL
jgi:hypothetical protein